MSNFDHTPFLKQAEEYAGSPRAIARFTDELGENYAVVEMHHKALGLYYLVWDLWGDTFSTDPHEMTEFTTSVEWEQI